MIMMMMMHLLFVISVLGTDTRPREHQKLNKKKNNNCLRVARKFAIAELNEIVEQDFWELGGRGGGEIRCLSTLKFIVHWLHRREGLYTGRVIPFRKKKNSTKLEWTETIGKFTARREPAISLV